MWGKETKGMKDFNSLVREMRLKENTYLGGRLTWSNFRSNPTCCKLDRFLFLLKWENRLNFNVKQEINYKIISNHCPILLSIETKQ